MLDLKSLKDRIPEVTGIALVLLLLSTVWLGVRYVNQAEWVRHTLQVQAEINQIWSLLQDVDIGQRTYVLTGEERFLAPYKTAKAQVPGRFGRACKAGVRQPDADRNGRQRTRPSSMSASPLRRRRSSPGSRWASRRRGIWSPRAMGLRCRSSCATASPG